MCPIVVFAFQKNMILIMDVPSYRLNNILYGLYWFLFIKAYTSVIHKDIILLDIKKELHSEKECLSGFYSDTNIPAGLRVIKLLSMKFQLLINVEIVKTSPKFRFNTQQLVIYPAH